MEGFNKSLKEWYAAWGCTTEFSFRYDHQGRKFLEVAAIDLPVHRRDPIGGETLGAMLERAGEGTVNP